jgi:Zn-dependent protease
LPGILLLIRSPFLFGYAKPVPVNFRALRSPRRDTMLVAAAGPAMNIALATLAALAFHIVGYLPVNAARWLAANLRNALLLNVVLAVFNLFPLPPLVGGRILIGLLPGRAAASFSRLEPYGIPILIGLLILLPALGVQFGADLSSSLGAPHRNRRDHRCDHSFNSQYVAARKAAMIISPSLDVGLGHVLICGRPSKCKRFLKKIGT